MDEKQMGNRVRRLREIKAWTQEHLAEAARVSVRTVQRAEEGTMSAETLTALAGALDVAVQDITQPKGPRASWPRITPILLYQDSARALDFVAKAFGFEVRVQYPGSRGEILHSELLLDGQEDGLIMLATAEGPASGKPRQSLYLYVDDVEAHCRRAREAGARIVTEPMVAHGDKRYLAEDFEGQQWWFAEVHT